MPVPTYDQFIEPLLRFLAEHHDAVSIVDAYEALAERANLSDADRAMLLPSGTQAVFKNRIGWAHDRLKRVQLSESPKRGLWQLTAAGRAFAEKHATLSDAELERIASSDREPRVKVKGEKTAGSGVAASPSASASPEERIGVALTEIRERVARDLLENILRSPPQFFETLVLDLLHKMGYGTDRSALQRVGGSGDGGIDGIISLDALGLEKIYVQAKRWQNPVGSPEIQTFMGALQLKGATKGVFITTSTFTKTAVADALRARGQIVLVDGAQLTSLMMDHGVGVQDKAFRVPKLDSDYFDEG